MTLKTDIKRLEGKPEAVLQNLLAEAHRAESLAKMELYKARTRVVALPSDAGQPEHEDLHRLSKDVDEKIAYVQAIKDHIERRPIPVKEQNSKQEEAYSDESSDGQEPEDV